MMSRIRKVFRVPAKRGAKVVYTASDGDEMEGVVTGSKKDRHGLHVRVRLGNNTQSFLMHPIHRLRYL